VHYLWDDARDQNMERLEGLAGPIAQKRAGALPPSPKKERRRTDGVTTKRGSCPDEGKSFGSENE